MTETDISVVVCTYNRADSLQNALADLVSQDTGDRLFLYEIVVVDDASTDNTQEVIDRFIRTSRVPIRSTLGEGSGVARARNMGIGASAGGWIAFFDDDQRVSPTWLEQLWLAALGQKADFVGGPIDLDLPDGFRLGPACRAIYGEYPHYRARRVAQPLPPGGNRLIRRSVFEQIGTHDESIVTGGEDLDLLSRAVSASCRFGWAPSAIVHHVIPEQRLRPDRIREYCRQAGSGLEYVDFKRAGRRGVFLGGTLRIGKMLVGNVPLLLWAGLARSTLLALDSWARFWMTAGYLHGAFMHLWPWAAERWQGVADSSFRGLRS